MEGRVGFARVGATLFQFGYSPVSDFEFDFTSMSLSFSN